MLVLLKKIVSFIVIICLIAIIFIFIPQKQVLIFYEKNSGNIAAYMPTFDDQHFNITFVHSIHLTDVVEKYRITAEDKIEQHEIVFEEFGIGMPSTVEEGEEFFYEDGKYHIKNLNNVFDDMKIRNGKTVSEHRFTWFDKNNDEHTVLFNDFFEPGNWYTVKVELISLFSAWKEVKIHD